MMKKIATIFVLTFFLLQSFAQENSSKKYSGKSNDDLLKAARKAVEQVEFEQARDYYRELLKRDSLNLRFNFEMALTFFESPNEQLKCLPYLQRVADNLGKDTLVEAYYYLGKAQHLSNNFDAAIASFQKYLDLIKVINERNKENDEEGRFFIQEAERSIEQCENAKTLTKIPVTKIEMNGRLKDFEIVNLKGGVNTKYDDYNPVLSPDDSVLIFTSRRKKPKKNKVDLQEEGKYVEDMYISKLTENGWGVSSLIPKDVNGSINESPNQISVDGNKFYFTRSVNKGTFYVASFDGKNISDAVSIDPNGLINTDSWETTMFISDNGQALYFSSQRSGGMGGRDIYVSYKAADGSWGKPKNLGEPINTEYDDDAPFITSDGKTMFFASKGHNSMGGFDVFKSTLENGKWSEPRNLGFPINTPGNDIYFILNSELDKAYYSSSRADAEVDGNDVDIFSIDICDELPYTTLKGVVRSIDAPIKDVVITVFDKESNKKIARYLVPSDGRFNVNLLRNKTNILLFEGKGMVYFAEELTPPRQCKLYDFYQEIELKRFIDLSASQWIQQTKFKNAFFDIRKKAAQAGFNDTDEFVNYNGFLTKTAKDLKRLNYSEAITQSCLSDIYDAAKLKLSFFDPAGNLKETALYNKGFFNFRSIGVSDSGLFKIEGQDPELSYTVNVVIGADTIKTEQVSNGFKIPSIYLKYVDGSGKVLETAVINYQNVFKFSKIKPDDKGVFRLENADPSLKYNFTYIDASGKQKNMIYQQGGVYARKTLMCFDNNANFLESADLSKDGSFTFKNVTPGDNLVFKSNDEDNANYYDVKLTQGGFTKANLTYFNGHTYPKLMLHFFKPNGAFVESAVMQPTGEFILKSNESEQGFYKLEGDNSDEQFLLKIDQGGKRTEVVRSRDGFIRADKLSPAELAAILKQDSLIVFGDRKRAAALQDSALATLISRNAANYKQQMLAQKQQPLLPDTVFTLPPRRLICLNAFGQVIASARLTNGNQFNFSTLPSDQFLLYRIEGEEPDPEMVYTIHVADQGKGGRTFKTNEMAYQDGFVFEQKQMNFYNSQGVLIETASINKKGEFVFQKVDPDAKGMFKLETDEPGLAIYALKFQQQSKVSELLFQSGVTYPKQVLNGVDLNGNIIETVYPDNKAVFSFSKLLSDQTALFQLNAADSPLQPFVKIKLGGNNVETVRSLAGYVRPDQLVKIQPDYLPVADSVAYASIIDQLDKVSVADVAKKEQLIQQAIAIINKNENVKQAVVYAYNNEGQIIDYAKASKRGVFNFQKLSATEYGLFKMQTQLIDPTLDLKISINTALASKQIPLKSMQSEDGYLFASNKMNFVDDQGKVLETATMNKKGEFVFSKVKPDQKGTFKLVNTTTDQAIYSVQLSTTSKAGELKFQDGVVFKKRLVHVYDASGKLLETATQNKDGYFVLTKLPLIENGLMKVEADDVQSIDVIKIKAGELTFEAIKSTGGFVRVESMPASQLIALTSKDSALYAQNRTKLQQLSYTDSTGRKVILKEMLALVEKNRKASQTTLAAYDQHRRIVEVVCLTKGNEFVFTKLTPKEFNLFKINNVQDPSLNYIVKYGSNGNSYALNTFQKTDSVLYATRKMNFYDSNGQLVETSIMSSNETFAFNKVSSDQAGTFKLDDGSDLNLYPIKLKTKSLVYEGGNTYALKKLNLVDSKGKVVETAIQDKNGVFAFNKQSSYESATFVMDGEENKQDVILKLNLGGKRAEAIRTTTGFSRIDRLNSLQVAGLSSNDKDQFASLKEKLNSGSLTENERTAVLDQIQTLLNKQVVATAKVSSDLVSKSLNKKDSLTKLASAGSTNQGQDVVAETGNIPEFENILFDYDKAIFNNSYKAELNNVVTLLKSDKKLKVEVSGHTDSKGDEKYNLALSKRRVNAVVDYLSDQGIASKRIKKAQFGKSRPVAANDNPDGSDNPEGRKLNRRVEVKVQR